MKKILFLLSLLFVSFVNAQVEYWPMGNSDLTDGTVPNAVSENYGQITNFATSYIDFEDNQNLTESQTNDGCVVFGANSDFVVMNFGFIQPTNASDSSTIVFFLKQDVSPSVQFEVNGNQYPQNGPIDMTIGVWNKIKIVFKYNWLNSSSLMVIESNDMVLGSYVINSPNQFSIKSTQSFKLDEVVYFQNDFSLGLDQSKKVNMTSFPNPTTDRVQLNWDSSNDFDRMEVFDNSGKLVFSTNIQDQKNMMILPMEDYPTGMYHVTLTGNRSRGTSTIVKN